MSCQHRHLVESQECNQREGTCRSQGRFGSASSGDGTANPFGGSELNGEGGRFLC